MLPAGTYNVSYAQDIAIIRTRLQWILGTVFLLFLFTFPLYGSARLVVLVDLMAISVVAVFGLYILLGLCGQISLGHAAFMAVGAYTSAILTARLGFPFWAAIPCAGLSAGIIGAVFGLPALRIKGLYLAVSTLAAQFIILWAIKYPLDPITGGAEGMLAPRASVGGITLSTPHSLFYLIMIVTVIMGLLAKNIARTRTGRAFVAIRDNDLAAEVMGINIFYYKVLAFFIGCFYAGVAGSLFAYFIHKIGWEQFFIDSSIWYLGMIIVGGAGSAVGAIVGPIFLVGLKELVTILAPAIGSVFPAIAGSLFAGLAKILFGIVIVAFLVFEPRGISHRWEIFKASYRLHPFAH